MYQYLCFTSADFLFVSKFVQCCTVLVGGPVLPPLLLLPTAPSILLPKPNLHFPPYHYLLYPSVPIFAWCVNSSPVDFKVYSHFPLLRKYARPPPPLILNFEIKLTTCQARHGVIARRRKKVEEGRYVEELKAEEGKEMNDISAHKVKVKGKAFPLQTWTGPWGSRRLRLQNF